MSTLAVIWRAAGLLLATDARAVVEVLAPLQCRPAPAVPDWVRGLFVYRTKLIPLVDASRLLGAPSGPVQMFNRVLVMRASAGGVPMDWLFGLWVDSVLDLDRIDFADPACHPGFATEGSRFLGTVAETPWGQMRLVRPEELFTPEQAAVLTQRLSESAA